MALSRCESAFDEGEGHTKDRHARAVFFFLADATGKSRELHPLYMFTTSRRRPARDALALHRFSTERQRGS